MASHDGDRVSMVSYHSSALEGNPIGASPERKMLVYLPPGYHHTRERYPVIYLLHGYGGDPYHPILQSRAGLNSTFSLAFRLLYAGVFRRVLTFEKLDAQITAGTLPPFILVQPDGSTHLPHLTGGVQPGGDPKYKGSMYYDSRGTGAFGRAVFVDAVDFTDTRYRTIARREKRAVMGGSMGGYGALLAGIFYPDRFSAVAAMSPSICGLDVLDIELYVPLLRWVLGKEGARKAGHDDLADILHTCDLIFSPDRPLVPSIVRDASGNSVSMDPVARANWNEADAGNLVRSHPTAFSDVAVRVSCEQRDEFGFADPDRRFAAVLEENDIPHELHIFRDDRALRISAHTVGIALQMEESLRFCLKRIG